MFNILFQHVLSSTTLTYKYDPYNLLYPWLGRGLLTANGHQWMLRRKLITPSFHFRILRDFLQIMNETSGRFMSLLERESDKAQSKVLDMQELVSRNTIDVICGMPYESLLNCFTSNETQPQRPQWVPESTVLRAKHLPLWPPSTRSATLFQNGCSLHSSDLMLSSDIPLCTRDKMKLLLQCESNLRRLTLFGNNIRKLI